MNAATRPATPDPVGDALVQLAGRVDSAVVVDVGGGSGTRAVPLARLGCSVLVVDSSVDALAILRRRARDAGVTERITAIQADAAALSGVVPEGGADLVLCHHLLETVDDPSAVMAGIAAALAPTGVASVLVAGRFAAVLAQAMAGRFADAAATLHDPEGRFGPADPLRRRFDVGGLERLLAAAGLEVESVSGLGVVAGLIPSRSTVPVDEPRMARLEADLAAHHELREIATDLHAVAARKAR